MDDIRDNMLDLGTTTVAITSEPPVELSTPLLFERDSRGLVKGVEYKFKKSGYRTVIDWRAMILPEHLVFNRQHQKEIEERYGKPLEQLKVTDVEDKYLLILLSGIKELAALRGYLDVDNKLDKVELNHCAARSRITWIGNFETCGREVTFSDGAGAHLDNTNGFGQLFLETIAINRAFVRSVRNFLGVNIVGQDEVGGNFAKKKREDGGQTVAFSPNSILEARLSDRGISFEVFRERVCSAYKDKLLPTTDPTTWKSCADLEGKDASTLLGLIK